MITKAMIEKGLEKGVVKLITDPNLESGTVCKIGDYWFYFAKQNCESLDPEHFFSSVPQKTAVNWILETLNEFQKDPDDYETEYHYYECILKSL